MYQFTNCSFIWLCAFIVSFQRQTFPPVSKCVNCHCKSFILLTPNL